MRLGKILFVAKLEIQPLIFPFHLSKSIKFSYFNMFKMLNSNQEHLQMHPVVKRE